MKTSNIVGVAAAAVLLTALEIGLAATLLSSGIVAKAEPAVQFEGATSRFTLEPIVVVASTSE